MSKFKEGMSSNYDSSFPRQNKTETLDDAGTKDGGLEFSRGFSLNNESCQRAKQFIESIERAIDIILKNS